MVSFIELSWECNLELLTELKGKAMIAKTEMLIRRPVAEVFEAFTNPDITTKFWFTKSSGQLETGKRLR